MTFGIPSAGDEARSLVFVSQGHYKHKYQPLQGTDVSIRTLDVLVQAAIPQAPLGQYWDVEISELLWNFGDGTNLVTGPRVTHVYGQPGEYVITVRIAHTDGHVKLDRRVISFSDDEWRYDCCGARRLRNDDCVVERDWSSSRGDEHGLPHHGTRRAC